MVLHRFFGTATIYRTCQAPVWFFTGSLAPLPYTEPVKLLYGSSPVLWHRYYIQNLLSSCMVLHRFFGTATIYRTCQAPVWFFTGSLAPLPYTEPVKLLYGSSPVLWHRYHIQNLSSSCMVLHRFFGTATIYRTC